MPEVRMEQLSTAMPADAAAFILEHFNADEDDLGHDECSYLWRAVEAGKLVAVLWATPQHDALWIRYVAVEIDARRRGLGREMIRHAARHAHETGLRNVGCQPQRGPGFALRTAWFTRLGFAEDHELGVWLASSKAVMASD